MPIEVVGGGGAHGIFDPSVARDPGTGRLWMSYSAVDPVAGVPPGAPWGVGLRLAWSDDRGATWQDAGVPVSPFLEPALAVDLPATSPEADVPAGTAVTVQSETSTIAFDADDPAEPWKLLWHQVLWAGGAPYFVSYSWIALKSAATPEGLAAAVPVALFGGYGLQPTLGVPAIALDALDPDLAGCVLAEPGLLATAGAIHLTLDCHRLGPPPTSRVFLLACATPCAWTDAGSWRYVGRLLEPSDAQALDPGYSGFSGTALLERGGSAYLLATPVAAAGGRYDGCRVYRFADLGAGVLERSAGRLVTVARVRGIPGTHHGACAHHAELGTGILLSQLAGLSPPDFRVEASGIDVP
ncbi:MAG TPA: sialidase family protein [Anaeromyxobacteraceae bacterium]|nr:sialidase family protein [Anaeromyxobacteraceae bacterium]